MSNGLVEDLQANKCMRIVSSYESTVQYTDFLVWVIYLSVNWWCPLFGEIKVVVSALVART